MPRSIPYFLRAPDNPIRTPIVTSDGFEFHPIRYYQGDRVSGTQGWAYFPEAVAFDAEQYSFRVERVQHEWTRAGLGDLFNVKIPYLVPTPHRPPGVWNSSGRTDWHLLQLPIGDILFNYHWDLQRLPTDYKNLKYYRFGVHNISLGRYNAPLYPNWTEAEIENDLWWLQYRQTTGAEYMEAILDSIYDYFIYPACAKAGVRYHDLAHARVKIVKGVPQHV